MGRFEQELRDALARKHAEIASLTEQQDNARRSLKLEIARTNELEEKLATLVAASRRVVASGVLCADGLCEHADGTSPCDDLRRAVGR